jgi:hypothetical protein
LRYPDFIRNALLTRYRNQRRRWLNDGARATGYWPINFRLECPNEDEARRQPEAFGAWIAAWQSWHGPGTLAWTRRRWRGLGIQQMPEILSIHNPEEVAAWIGEESSWLRARDRYRLLVARWPLLKSSLTRYFDVLAEYGTEDFQRLEAVLGWLEANPRSNLYPRQIPVTGLDSKWLEARTAPVAALVAELCGHEAAGADFYQISGLSRPPHLTRLIILDKTLRTYVGGIRDLSAPAQELATLNLPAKRVYIVENLQTALAFGDLPRSVVFMRLGYGIDAVARLPWVISAECVYWGDIDTHGFRILSRLRSLLPTVRSILMNEEALTTHDALWGDEEEQTPETELPGLLPDEQRLYQRLKQHYWRVNLRLEQERIPWEYAWAVLQQ